MTTPFTFIHTADWHIGNPFSQFDRVKRKKLQDAVFHTIEMIFMYADKNNIPLILCAGDVVDNGQTCAKADLFKLFGIIKKYPRVKMVMIPGNHDPLVSQCIYRRVDRSNFPQNLELAEKDETIHYEQWKVAVSVASLHEKNGNYNPLAWLAGSRLNPDYIQIGLCHGSIKNAAYGDNSFPIEPDTAQRYGLDYLALGDWHSHQKINHRTAYSGAPEPLQMGDDGYPLLVTIDKPGALPQMEPIKNISQYRWQELNETVSVEGFAAFKTLLESVTEKEIRRMTVSGYLPLETYKIYKELIDMNRSRYMKIDDHVGVQPEDHQLLDAADGVMSDVVRKLIALKNSQDPLPDGIRDILANEYQTEVIELKKELRKEEIIDNALLLIYEYFAGSKQ